MKTDKEPLWKDPHFVEYLGAAAILGYSLVMMILTW